MKWKFRAEEFCRVLPRHQSRGVRREKKQDKPHWRNSFVSVKIFDLGFVRVSTCALYVIRLQINTLCDLVMRKRHRKANLYFDRKKGLNNKIINMKWLNFTKYHQKMIHYIFVIVWKFNIKWIDITLVFLNLLLQNIKKFFFGNMLVKSKTLFKMLHFLSRI